MGTSQRVGVAMGGTSVVLAILIVLYARCSMPTVIQAEPVAVAPPPVVAPMHEPEPEPVRKPPPPNPIDLVLGIPSARTAAETIRPTMEDTFDKSSGGSDLFLDWSMRHPLAWSDVAVVRDETSVALVMKDPDAERTKVMCVSGSIVEIAVQRNEYGKYFEGGIISSRLSIIHFRAVRSTGAIVQDSFARFCGFVTGRYDYPNSKGGVSHAVEMVGMFDLPENRSPAAVKR